MEPTQKIKHPLVFFCYNNSMKRKILQKLPYLIIAVVLLQTLSYKFTAHAESVALFSQINLFGLPEVYGRLGVGIVELLVSIGLFIPYLRRISLVGVVALMSGAVYFHTSSIGFEGDNLPLFISGLVALGLSLILLLKKNK
jgi:uncharacterized membrane protein YphA (DoxX/SURF4 family)